MNFFGLNSPAMFVISVIVLIILGPKRVEKGWLLFQRLLKFLLNNKEDISKDKLNLGLQLDMKPEVIAVKEEVVKAKSEKPEVIAVKEEVVEAKSEKPEVIAVKEEVVKAKLKMKKPKLTKIPKEK